MACAGYSAKKRWNIKNYISAYIKKYRRIKDQRWLFAQGSGNIDRKYTILNIFWLLGLSRMHI